MKLFEHTPHHHQPTNVNAAHAEERQGLNDKVAVFLTHTVGNMWTAYSFVVLAFVGLFAILGWLNPIIALLVAWASQTLIQLALLPVIMVGQNVLSRHAELQADEQFSTTQRSYHDIEQIISHLDAQDTKILEILERLELLATKPARKKAEVKSGNSATKASAETVQEA